MAIGLATAISKEISGEGTRELQEFKTKQRNQYKARLLALRNKLNQQYKIASQQERMNQLRTRFDNEIYEKIKNDINKNIKPSGKGGADLLFEDDGKTIGIKKLSEKYGLIDRFKQIREETFALKENNNILNWSLQAMQEIYAIRQDILQEEIEEHIAITFAAAGYQKLLTLPMSQFLQAARDINAVSLGTASRGSATFGDLNLIKMNINSKSIIEKLTMLEGARVSNLQYMKGGIMQDLTYQKEEKFFSELVNRRTFRTDKSYRVIQPGFLREAIVEAMFKNERTTYSQDNAPWYGKSDTQANEINGRKIGLSVKDLMGSSPTLVRLNSIFNIINITLKVLDSPLDDNKVQNFLANKVFSATSDLDESVVDQELEKLVAQSLGL